MKKSRSKRKKSSKPLPRFLKKGRGGGVVYGGKLPKHVKAFTYAFRGKKRTGYFSKITGKRIKASLIRQRRSIQAIRERFPKVKSISKIHGAINFYSQKDLTRVERDFMRDRYQELFKYLRRHAPGLLEDYEDEGFNQDFENEEEEVKYEKSIKPARKHKLASKAKVRFRSKRRKSYRRQLYLIRKQSFRKHRKPVPHRRIRRRGKRNSA